MYSDLIIGYDGSAAGRDALALGRRLADATAARATVVYVRPSALVPVETTDPTEDIFWDADVSGVLDEARAIVGDASGVRFLGVPDTSPARALHAAAADHHAALIVLGATHRSGLGRVIPGTTADNVLHAAPCAVAIAPAGYADGPPTRPFGMIVVAVDGGEETERVAAVGGAIARRTGARVRLVTVIERPYSSGPLYSGNQGYATLREALHESADAILDRAERAVGEGIDAERVAVEGHVGEAVARHSVDADLLVIGSRSYGPVRRVILGSAAAQILPAASVPVLAVPRQVAAPLDDAITPLGAAIAGAESVRPGAAEVHDD